MAFACSGGGNGDSGEEAPSCETGSERCKCYRDKTCDAGLVCLSDRCVEGDGATGGRASTPPASNGGQPPSSEAGGGPNGSGNASNGGNPSPGSPSTGGRAGSTGGRPSTSTGGAATGGQSPATGGSPTMVEGCTGLSTLCEDLDTAGCAAADGCFDGGYCGGVPDGCGGVMQEFCNDIPFCVWEFGACNGLFDYCERLDLDDCSETAGCTWYTECTGAPLECGGLTRARCDAQPGCEWGMVPGGDPSGEPSCVGTAVQCSRLTADQCVRAGGCSGNQSCVGTATRCDVLSSSQCSAQDGCQPYTNSQGNPACEGTPYPCSTYLSLEACAFQVGCDWESTCTGTATPCSAHTLPSQCGDQRGCAWQ